MVIFLFLRNLAATVIPSVAVPLSLVGTFGVMYLLGYSLNNLSLMALTISTGFVVDDAIVMIENITRYIEEGEPPLAGRAERVRADRLHDRFADDLPDRGADSAACSWATSWAGFSASSPSRWRSPSWFPRIVSLTLTPMMCSKLLKHSPEAEQTPLLSHHRTGLEGRHFFLRPNASGRPAPPDGDAAGGRRDAGADHCSLRLHSQRVLPDSGHRGYSGRLGSLGDGFVSGNGQAAASAGQDHPEGPGGRKPFFIHWSRWNQYHPE